MHNRRTYPTLLRLFAELGVETQESDMSMSISCAGCGLEYAGGRGLSGLHPVVPRTGAIPRYLRMLGEVVRFHRHAHALLSRPDDSVTLREFLAAHGFSRYFVAHFLTPLVAAVWSTAPTRAGDYPARYLFVFLANHGMLSVTGSPQLVHGRRRVGTLRRAGGEGPDRRQTSTPVRSIERTAAGVDDP